MNDIRRLDSNNNLDNVPHMLRNLAADIEAGDESARTVMVITIEDGNSIPSLFHFGQALSRLEEVGALAACTQIILQVEKTQ